jgi:membrane protein implicated in regulation of membrane protease activity
MTWADFYLICFAVGFTFSILSFVLGGLHWHLPFHFHVHVHGGPVHAGHPVAGGHAGPHGAGPHHTSVSPINPVTLAAFLAWFGGMGFLLTRFSGLAFFAALGLSLLAGLVAAGIVFVFLVRVLMSDEEELDPADYEMVGVLGKISMPIRKSGTGELVYSQMGTRRACGARAEDGTAIARGTEVVVTRYEKGIAYVRLWSELAGEETQVAEQAGPSPAESGGAQ